MKPTRLHAVPSSLAPFFQEYNIADLIPERDSHTIIERVLQFGNRAEIKWLFSAYPETEVSDWVRTFGKDKLPQPHRAFWQIVFEINE